MSGIDYDKAKALAASSNPAERLKLAQRADTQPEILYYLAIDEAEAVRRAIAENEATPGQAHLLLARVHLRAGRVESRSCVVAAELSVVEEVVGFSAELDPQPFPILERLGK